MPTFFANEVWIRRWAFTAVALTMVILAVPDAWRSPLNSAADSKAIVGLIFFSLIGAIIFGFHVRMLLDCIRDKGLQNRFGWLTFLVVVPVISAYMYFFLGRRNES
jgi:hypothetical protein